MSKTIYVGGVYELDKTSGGSVTRTVTYYPAAGAIRVDGTLYYTLKDHLGSASVVTDGTNGNILGEQRYNPFGETRVPTGSMFTDKLFTSQREMAGLGIYHYGARFYSPKLARFISADTIVPGAGNPQSLNRYAYVLNNPIRYNDPSGHVPADCYGTDYCGGQNSTLLPDLNTDDDGDNGGDGDPDWDDLGNSGYSEWEVNVLQELFNNGGPNAVYGVNYILDNNIHITVDSGWQSGGGSRGAWYEGNNLIVLNVDQGYDMLTMPNEWGLANVIHEARHIEQGKSIASSKFGEMDAWQIGIDVAEHLGWYDDVGWSNRDLDVKYSKTVDSFANAIQANDPGYWNALTEWLPPSITDHICIGLCTFPDFPSNIVLSQ